jgi:hypothetical protein
LVRIGRIDINSNFFKLETTEITDLVRKDFELTQNDAALSEEELLHFLSEEVALMMETRMDFLLGLMYRLDIDEGKINRALSPISIEAPNVALAKLILERQKQRVLSKKMYKTEKIEGWDDF